MKKQVLLSVALAIMLFASQTKAQTDTSKTPATRVLPSPLPSPPFPGADWDGGPIIGSPNDDTNYPLEKLLGLAGNKMGLHMYGWLDLGGNLSTSKNSNVPLAYDLVPNTGELDQVVLRFERDPNTVQTDHVDWGIMDDNIYGADYRYIIAKGIFSNQLLKYNNLYGYDMTQLYGLLYAPKVAEGLLIKAGRFISPSDIEAQWAPANYLYSHSLMFTVDPYTFTGVMGTTKLSKYFQFELGITAGNDVAPWSNSASPNGMLMVRWVSRNNNNSLYGGLPALGRGYYSNEHDDLQMFVETWGHRFSKRLHMMTEGYYMWQRNALTGGTVINGPAQSFFESTGPGTLVHGSSPTLGLVNYFQILIGNNDKNYISIRNDMLDDIVGNRTGYATLYTSHTIGFSHHFSDRIMVRPEIRYERAWVNGATPYDNGTKAYQATAAMDLVLEF